MDLCNKILLQVKIQSVSFIIASFVSTLSFMVLFVVYTVILYKFNLHESMADLNHLNHIFDSTGIKIFTLWLCLGFSLLLGLTVWRFVNLMIINTAIQHYEEITENHARMRAYYE